MSWRISTLFDNRSQKVLPTPGSGLGATVIQSSRGPKKPVYFTSGETARILNLFGVPTSDNPELMEAIEYNKSYPIYISSPTNLGKSAALLIGTSGSESLNDGIDINATNDLSNLTLFSKLTSNSTTLYSGVIGRPSDIIKSGTDLTKFKLLVDGVEESITLTENSGVYTIAGTNIASGSFTLDDGSITIEFTSNQDEDSLIEIEYSVNLSTYYSILALNGPSDADYLRATVKSVVINSLDAFEMSLEIKNTKNSYVEMVDSPITFSLATDHENGYGENIYIENIFDNSDLFTVITDGGATYSTFTDDTSATVINKGYRGGIFGDTEFTTGYAYFEKVNTYPVDLFFDATANTSIPSIYSNLRTNFRKYARYILPTPYQSIADTLSWTMPVSDRGISFYYGWFYMKNLYGSASKLLGTPIGEVAKKHADIMIQAFGGLAPAWYDENGMGGQLTGGRILEALFEPSEDQLKLLDEARINPITYDYGVGAIIKSRRTSLSGSLSDWSFIDYSGAMDYIINNITTQVLPYQIVKMNDSNHRAIVRSKVEGILQPMTVSPVNVVRDYAIKCDSENNNDTVLEREEFRLDLAVKFTPKARTIVFTFINTPQGSSVEEMFE